MKTYTLPTDTGLVLTIGVTDPQPGALVAVIGAEQTEETIRYGNVVAHACRPALLVGVYQGRDDNGHPEIAHGEVATRFIHEGSWQESYLGVVLAPADVPHGYLASLEDGTAAAAVIDAEG